jgi:hypothetical protein
VKPQAPALASMAICSSRTTDPAATTGPADASYDGPRQLFDVGALVAIGEEVESEDAFTSSEVPGALGDLVDRSLENARVSDHSTRERTVLDGATFQQRVRRHLAAFPPIIQSTPASRAA